MMAKSTMILLLVAVLFVYFATLDVSSVPLSVTISVDSSFASQVWLIAKENGFFQDLPFNVIIKDFSQETDSLTNFFLGHVQIAHAPFIDYLYGSSVNNQEQYIRFVGKNSTFLALETNRVSDEKNDVHVVGMTPLTAMYYMNRMNFQSSEDLTLRTSDKVVDGRSMYYSDDESMQMIKDNMLDVMVISKNLVEESPEVLDQLLEAYYQGVVYLKRHPEEIEHQENYEFFSKEEADRNMEDVWVEAMILQVEEVISELTESSVVFDSNFKYMFIEKEE